MTTPNTPANGGQILTDELLPCPFCGGPAKVIGAYNAFAVNCSRCDAYSPSVGSKELASSTWNRRATPQAPTPAAAEGRAERIMEVLTAERDQARAKYDHVFKVMMSVFNLAPRGEDIHLPDGRVMWLKDPNAAETLHALGRAIWAIPEKIAAAPASTSESSLIPHLRQLRHNDGSEGFVFAYEKEGADREFARLRVTLAAPLPRQAAVRDEFSAHPDRIIQQANEVRDAVRYQLVRTVYGASARLIPGPMHMAETPEQFDAAVDQIRAYRAAAKPANSGEA